ncbi:MAG TPA: flagellar hook-associated protein FlgK [Xanthobacteraceae bacterium]|nr:flagellar hook-associated protein FlgK [Xanthobacteraceae bacterium]
MSLTQSLGTSLAGLNAAQQGLSVVSGNIANANTPGYVRQTADQVEVGSGGTFGASVDVTGINRNLDALVQSQLWTETSGGSYADAKASLYQQLQQVYGTPGTPGAFDTAYNNFTAALQNLSTSPSSYAAQTGVLSAAQQLTQNLNSMSGGIQQLRTQAEQNISDAVTRANQAMQTIAQLNQQLSAVSPQDSTTATLEDQRDQAITQLTQLMNVTVVKNNNDQVSIFTSSGLQLVGLQASQLKFDDRGSLSASALWSADPSKDGVGTITLQAPDGTSTDLLANNGIQSGQIAAYVQARDQILPQAQGQLDELAAQMSEALSNQTTNGTAITSGSQSGFSADISGMLPGNSLQVTYTDPSNVQHTVTIVRVDDPAALPLPNTSSNPNNQVIGVNFSNGYGSVVNQLNAALGSNLQFSIVGSVLSVLNTPALTSTVNAVSTTTTANALANGSPQLPLFTDGNTPISGAITALGSQDVGLAGRITVNSAVLANPQSLVVYQTSPATPVGDSTRPNFLLNQLTTAKLTFPASTGIGSSTAPFSGTLSDFMSQVISQQSQAASAASSLQQGQDVVVNALQQRFNNDSGVNVDSELSNLISLQQTYEANARVMTTVQAMMTTLMQIL